MKARSILMAAGALLAFAQCQTVGPDYAGPPDLFLGERFSGGVDRGKQSVELDRWWKRLGSRNLNRLVEQALDSNLDVAVATQRLREARALRQQAGAALLPHAGTQLSWSRLNAGSVTGGGSLDGLSELSGGAFQFDNTFEYWGSGIDLSWEIDVFGGQRREQQGAEARAQATAEALHGVRQALVAEVVETYYAIAALREQAAAVERQVSVQQAQAEVKRRRFESGAVTRLELDRAEARLELTRAELPRMEAGITSQRQRLALLLGGGSAAFDATRGVGDSMPDTLPVARSGLPGELLLRRPDVRQRERELAAATEDIGVATANFYPKFRIGNSGPLAIGADAGDLFQASNYVFQLGPRVEWSLFSGGANRAILEGANARQRVALLEYEKAVRSAVAEVETELANLKAETERLAMIQRSLAASRSAVKQVRSEFDAGAVSQLDVLVEEEQLRDVELIEIRSKSQMLQIWTRLHKALGGGWQ